MIPRDYITEWRDQAPWVDDAQVEQDLVICRALIDIFSHETLRHALAFRGGTALFKLHLPAARYSEDIDLVQVQADEMRTCTLSSMGRPTQPDTGWSLWTQPQPWTKFSVIP